MASKKQTKSKATLTWTKTDNVAGGHPKSGYLNERFSILHGVTKSGKPSKDFILYYQDDKGFWIPTEFRGTLAECKAEAERQAAYTGAEQRPDPIPSGPTTTGHSTPDDAKLLLYGEEISPNFPASLLPNTEGILSDPPPVPKPGETADEFVDRIASPRLKEARQQALAMPSAERRTSPRKGKTKPQDRKRSVTINRVDWSQLKPNTKKTSK